MEACKEYLKKAKANQSAISMGDLMERFGLSLEQVRQCVGEVYG